MKNYKKVNLISSTLSDDQLSALRKVLPEAFGENKIDWDKLRAALGDTIDAQVERFGFMWAGKSGAVKNVLIPSKATLKPSPDESVNFDTTENLFIEGDNLEALKLLQKAYFQKVKMIYIDPPYNTGNDFVYSDDFKAPLENYLAQTGQKDGDGHSLTTNRETSGRYHSDWLNMMYPRLKIAWSLLRDDGVIFISIDDNEVHHLRMMMDEIFGEENFVASIVWEKRFTRSNNSKMFATLTEIVLLYRKSESLEELKEPRSEKADSIYSNPDNDPRGVWTSVSYVNPANRAQRPNLSYNIKNPFTGKIVEHPTNAWKYEKAKHEKHVEENRLYWGVKGENTYPRLKKFLSEMDGFMVPVDLWEHDDTGTTDEGSKIVESLLGVQAFDFPKPPRLIQRMLRIATKANEDDIILDFFAGSGTTAHAVMAQNADDGGNRKWICVQLPEQTPEDSDARKAGYKNIADIAKQRIERAIQKIGKDLPYENHKRTEIPKILKEHRKRWNLPEEEIKMDGINVDPKDIDLGFKVFKLASSNYPENLFEFDPEKSEEENTQAFEEYLRSAQNQKSLLPQTNDIDVVYENIIKEGLSLNSNITEEKIGGNKVYVVVDGERELRVCLDAQISKEAINTLTSKGYKGKLFICLDTALDDTAKANLGLNVELKTI